MKNKIEILAPAGSYESFQAAICAGADAVYLAGNQFGARAYADNFSEEQLIKAIEYAHLHGRKVYLTVNTLLKEKELQEKLYDYLLPYYKHGLDAVIVQDVGVLQYIKEQFPNLPIHASTQMTITNVLGAKFLQEMGAERVVTARELQLEEIRQISDQTEVEIESFVHGALCYCYSGQCLYSSMIGGRSGNRGQCAQPCRLPYKSSDAAGARYLLSLKDICTIEHIPDLIEAGIDSFKIEGRMKKPEYVALVTFLYRKYTDLYFEYGKERFYVDPKDKENLMDLYNRGGSDSGYYYKRNGKEMLSWKRPNHGGISAIQVIRSRGREVIGKALVDLHKGDVIELQNPKDNITLSYDTMKGKECSFVVPKGCQIHPKQVLIRTRNDVLIREIREQIANVEPKVSISGKLFLREGRPAALELFAGSFQVKVEGECPQAAINQPMEPERIEKQMRKTGGTPFVFEDLDVQMEGDLFIPLQSINELRRRGISELKEKMIHSFYRENVVKQERVQEKILANTEIQVYASVEELEQLDPILECEEISRVYMDCNAIAKIWESEYLEEMIHKIHMSGKEIYMIMPSIFRQNSIKRYETHYDRIFQKEWDGVMIRNMESYVFLKNHGYSKEIVTDCNLYHFNRYAKKFWKQQGVSSFSAPLELNYKELKEVGIHEGELVVYGYAPMMVSAQCIQKTTSECTQKKGLLTITDRMNKKFQVKNHCDYCYNVIYNTLPLALFDQKELIRELSPKAIRLSFTIENRDEVKKILGLYRQEFVQDCKIEDSVMGFTRGHFKRGIK